MVSAASVEAVDIDEAVRMLRAAGVHPPLLLRFPDIVAHRLNKLQVQSLSCEWPKSIVVCSFGALSSTCCYTFLVGRNKTAVMGATAWEVGPISWQLAPVFGPKQLGRLFLDDTRFQRCAGVL